MDKCPVDHASLRNSSIPKEYNPLSPEQVENPFPMMARAREECPVFFSPMYQMWFVTRHEDVCQVLKETETFSSVGIISVHSERTPPEVAKILEGGYPQIPGMTDNDPPGHDRVRSLVGQAFSQKIVAAMEPHIRGIADEMFDPYSSDGEFEVLEKYAFPFPLVVIGDILGVERKHLPNLKQWCDDWVALLSGLLTLEQQLEAARGFVAFQKFYYDTIEAKRRSPKQDLISHMINAREGDRAPLTTLEMVNVCMSATWAGHQTSTSMIVSMLFHLLQDRSRWEHLLANRQDIPKAVEETLRIDSPLLGMLRFTKKATTLGGVEIPAGQPVQVLFASANHDEEAFPQPEKFDLHRKGTPHLGFGRGVHYCLGSQLARLEGKVAIEALMDRAPNLRMKPGQQIEYLPNFIYRSLKELHLEWDAATRSPHVVSRLNGAAPLSLAPSISSKPASKPAAEAAPAKSHPLGIEPPAAPNTGRILDAWFGGKHHFPADKGAADGFRGIYPEFPKVFRLLRDFIGRACRHVYDQGIDQFLVLGAGIPTQGNVHEAVPGARVLYTDLDPVNVQLGQQILKGTRSAYTSCDATQFHASLDKVEIERALGPIHRLGIVVVGVHAFMTDAEIERTLSQLHQWAPAGSMLVADFDGEGLAAHPQALAILDGAGSKLFMRRPKTIAPLLGPWQPSPEGIVPADAWRNPNPERHQPVFMYGCTARKL